MEETSNYVHCKTFDRSEVFINVEQGGAKVELLNGKAHLQPGNGSEPIEIPATEKHELKLSEYTLTSETSFSFKIHGHYRITKSQKKGSGRTLKMFEVIQTDSSKIEFVIGKGVQLLMLHRNEYECISFEINRVNRPEVLGPVFHCESDRQRFYLPPFSTVLLKNNPSSDTAYSVIIINVPKEMDFYISPFVMEWEKFTKAQTAIQRTRQSAISVKRSAQVYLVSGKRNFSKIAFCTFFINKVLDAHLAPVYVDLNVHENSSGIPGSVQIAQIVGQGNYINSDGCHISKIYLKKNEKVFTLGYEDPNSNIRLYYLLMKKLAYLSREMSKEDTERKSVTLVDMCDSFLNNPTAIKRVCSDFKFNKIIVIGDQGLQEKMSNLRNYYSSRRIEFIQHVDDFELRNDHFRNSLIKEYVGIQNNFVVKFSDIQIYKIEGSAGNVEFDTIIRPEQFRAVPVAFNNDLERHFLGVSECSTIVKDFPVTPVKYFVVILSVEMEKQQLTVKSPNAEPLSRSILIKGDIRVNV